MTERDLGFDPDRLSHLTRTASTLLVHGELVNGLVRRVALGELDGTKYTLEVEATSAGSNLVTEVRYIGETPDSKKTLVLDINQKTAEVEIEGNPGDGFVDPANPDEVLNVLSAAAVTAQLIDFNRS